MGTRPFPSVPRRPSHIIANEKIKNIEMLTLREAREKENAGNSHCLKWLPPSRCEQRIVSRLHEARLITFPGISGCEHALQIPLLRMSINGLVWVWHKSMFASSLTRLQIFEIEIDKVATTRWRSQRYLLRHSSGPVTCYRASCDSHP